MLLGSLPIHASAYAQGSDFLKVALIGCGGRGTGAASQTLAADEGVKLVAMADIFSDRLNSSLERISQRYGSDKVDVPEENKFIGFDAYKKAIELADVIILPTPPGFRPFHIEEAVKTSSWLNSIEYEWIWDRDILNSKTYAECTNWHIKELSRLRFLPREWPDKLKAMLSGLSGREMLIISQLESSILFTDYEQWLLNDGKNIENLFEKSSEQWNIATQKDGQLAQDSGFNLDDFNNWNGDDLSVDFYRLRNAGGLAMRDIARERLEQYSIVASALHFAREKPYSEDDQRLFGEIFRNRFRTVFEVMSLFANRLPDDQFSIDLQTGNIRK